MEALNKLPWTSIIGVFAAIAGAVIVIGWPENLSYEHYLQGLGVVLGGAGALGIARNEAGKGTSVVIAFLDELPWASIIGVIAAGAGAVVVIVHPTTLDFQSYMTSTGTLLIGAGVFGFARSKAGKGVAARS